MPSNLHEYLKYISDDSPTGNFDEEIKQVLLTVIDGKTEEEKASIKTNLMKDGFVRYVADFDIIDLIAKVFMCKCTNHVHVPADEYELFYSMALLASCVGFYNSSTLLDDDLQPIKINFVKVLDELYSDLEDVVPGLISADEESIKNIKDYMLHMIRLTAQFVPKSNLLDILFFDMGVDWRKQGKFTSAELKKLSEYSLPEAEEAEQKLLHKEYQTFLQRKKALQGKIRR